jgi:hypothetical protein
MADVHNPDADRIGVVMDNLAKHTAAALYEASPAPEAHRVLECLEFHYTPKRPRLAQQPSRPEIQRPMIGKTAPVPPHTLSCQRAWQVQ